MNRNKEILSIPIKNIFVANPRVRNQVKFNEIVQNIKLIGLKKPITICPQNGEKHKYNLVCGQGRMEAYIALGKTEIPAVIVNEDKESQLLMSLVENIARRHHSGIELAKEVVNLSNRGHTISEISNITGVTTNYIANLIKLFDKGEERLISSLEKNKIPLQAAMLISNLPDKQLQKNLEELYTNKKITLNELKKAKRITRERALKGKKIWSNKNTSKKIDYVKVYQDAVSEQKLMVDKAKLCNSKLQIIISSFKLLFNDDNFLNLLKAENHDTFPEILINLKQEFPLDKF